MTTTELFVHTLKGGVSRNTMILEISQTVDEGVLVDGWENSTTEEILELYNILVVEAAE